MLVNAPPLGPQFDWEQQADAYRTVVFNTLAQFGLDLRGHIRSEAMLTPADLWKLTGAWRGARTGSRPIGR